MAAASAASSSAAAVGVDGEVMSPSVAGAAAAAAARPHVVVVGGGLAGLVAALSAADGGARVTLFEKEKGVGGNSAKATSGMNTVGTAAQAAAGVDDYNLLFFADTVASGKGQSDPTLVRTLAAGAGDAVAYVARWGVDLAAVTLCGGHSVARTHHEAPRADGKPTPVGWDIIAALRRGVEARSDVITVRTSTAVASLVSVPGRPGGGGPEVRGVVLAPAADATGGGEVVAADAVVLTTGGFGADHTARSLLTEFAPHLAGLPTTNGAFARGDGVRMARAVGAHLRGMREVQVHPTGLIDPADPTAGTKFLGPEALRGVGALLLNHRGARFVNELGTRDAVVAAMYRHCAVPGATTSAAETGLADDAPAPPAPVHAFIVLNAAAVAHFGPNFNFYWRVKRMFTEVAGAAGLAAAIGDTTTPDAVAATLRAYAAAAAGGAADEFGKTAFPEGFADAAGEGAAPLLYVARVTPAIHYTMGGVALNAAAELLYSDASEVEAARTHGLPSVSASPQEGEAEAVAHTVRAVLAAAASPAAGGAGMAAIGVTSPSPSPSPVPTPTPTATPVPATPLSPTSMLEAAAGAGVRTLVATLSSYHLAADLRREALVSASGLVVPPEGGDDLFARPVLRPIRRLYGAGEVTGGLHGGNRLAGNSLLECVVFGRIAGARAAAAGTLTTAALNSATFTPLRFRESHRVAESVFTFRFDLPSPLHTTGLAAGQYVAVRAVLDGKEVVRYYSPISRPDDVGHIDVLLKVDASGGAMTTHVGAMQPGDTLEFKGPLGSLALDFSPASSLGHIKKIGLIAGGTGVAPMSQVLRSAFHYNRSDIQFKMVYAAAAPDQLAYLRLLQRKARSHPNFELFTAVDRVPEGSTWSGHVGYVTADVLRDHMFPPADDLLIIVCGPYPMCQAMKNKVLPAAGYTPAMYFSYM